MREAAALLVWSTMTWVEFWTLPPESLWHIVTWPIAGCAVLYGSVMFGRRLLG
jgi:hypothetical protein